jgi:hypothetical protein
VGGDEADQQEKPVYEAIDVFFRQFVDFTSDIQPLSIKYMKDEPSASIGQQIMKIT